MEKKIKLSTLVRRAAKRVFDYADTFSCNALSSEIAPGTRPAVIAQPVIAEYAGLFSAEEGEWPNGAWLTGVALEHDPEKREWRITALCLFADILEAEGR